MKFNDVSGECFVKAGAASDAARNGGRARIEGRRSFLGGQINDRFLANNAEHPAGLVAHVPLGHFQDARS
jgi:hypothetical protein